MYMSLNEAFSVGCTTRAGLAVNVQLPVQEVVTFWSAFGHFLSQKGFEEPKAHSSR